MHRDPLSHQKPRFVISELHEFALAKMGCNQESLRGFMVGLGYSTFRLDYSGPMPSLFPTATRIHSTSISNLLFSTPEWVDEYWPTAASDPRKRLRCSSLN